MQVTFFKTLDINYYGDMETQLFTVIITCRPIENCKFCLMQAKFSETSVSGYCTYTVVKASPVLNYNVITKIGLYACTTTMYPNISLTKLSLQETGLAVLYTLSKVGLSCFENEN